jgi:hypothetical protein
MQNLLKLLFDKLGHPGEQKSEQVALAIVYCMFLAFTLVCVLGSIAVSHLTKIEKPIIQSCPTASLK